MKNQVLSVKEQRRKRMLFALPLLIIPFVSFFLWSLGVFSQTVQTTVNPSAKQGLQLELPEASSNGQSFDKFTAYQQANRDSVRLQEQLRIDPYAKLGDTSSPAPSFGGMVDDRSTKMYDRIAQLQKVLNVPEPVKPVAKTAATDTSASAAIRQLQSMLASKNDKTQTDPELDQLSGIMDKIMDVQNPGRVKARDDAWRTAERHADKALVIEAVIPETQTLVSGAVVRLRLTQDLVIDSMTKVLKNSFVFGVGTLENERLVIHVQSVRSGGRIVPVNLSAYDLDGLEGIYVPGTITRDAAKSSAGEAAQDINFLSMDPSIKGQAIATGVSAAKNLLNKKAKLIRFTVSAGYQVLLREPIR